MLGLLQGAALTSTARFVEANRDERGNFKFAAAKLQVKELWEFEKRWIGAIEDYRKLCAERALGEVFPTEASAVAYDNLGHMTLCLLHSYPKWQAYALDTHRAEIETLAALGSWRARGLLGIPQEEPVARPDDQLVADRFFFGDVRTQRSLSAAYFHTN